MYEQIVKDSRENGRSLGAIKDVKTLQELIKNASLLPPLQRVQGQKDIYQRESLICRWKTQKKNDSARARTGDRLCPRVMMTC
jgi:hypothetical protein